MTSITCALAWLCAVLMAPLLLFIWALDTKKQELTGIEVTAGVGKRLQLFIMSPRQQLEGGLYLNKYFI